MATTGTVQPIHKALKLYNPKVGNGEFWDRKFYYVAPEFEEDMKRINPLKAGALDIIRPAEQLARLFKSFSRGERLENGRQFKKVRAAPDHVIELRTADVRVFGWSFARDVFIACHAEVLENLKLSPDPYPRWFANVVALRTRMGLGFVDSEDLNEHFSNL